MREKNSSLTAGDVLDRYREEEILEFFNLDIVGVNQHGHSGDTPLHVACSRREVPEILALLEGGADPNLHGDEGNTPLHNAILNRNILIIDILLEHGAMIDIENEFGVTAYQLAKMNGINLESSRG